MGMNKCYKCLHYHVCTKWRKPALYGITINGGCDNHFKAKTDYVEVVHGHWDEDHREYVCSCCQKHFTDELPWISHPEYGMPNYCPNCGAKMDGDGNG